MILYLLGLTLSISGVLLSLYGSYLLNQRKDYTAARIIFTFSNPLMLAAVAGSICQIWDSQLPLTIIAGLYAFYCCSSVYGWWK